MRQEEESDRKELEEAMREKMMDVDQLSWKPNKKQEAILNKVTQSFEEGTFYGIMGPNGSGKTSFIRHLLRFLEIQEGKIQLKNQALHNYPRKALATYISFVPQNVNLEVDFTAYEIVAMGRTPYMKRLKSLSEEDEKIIEHAMQITHCKSLKERPFSYLSGGEAQRVLVARAIAQDTKCLILDEPISHLDIRYQVEIMETLKYLNEKEGKTIIAILHDLNLCAAYCKQVVLMNKGEIYASGSAEEVLTKEHLKAVYEMNFEIYEQIDRKQKFYIPLTSSWIEKK